MNDILFAVMNDHSVKMSSTGPLNEEDILRLREEWKKSCHDIMQGAPEKASAAEGCESSHPTDR